MAQPTPSESTRPRFDDMQLARAYDEAHSTSGRTHPRQAARAHEAGLRAVAKLVTPPPAPTDLREYLEAVLGNGHDDCIDKLVDAGTRFSYPGEHLEYGFQAKARPDAVVDCGADRAKAEAWLDSLAGDVVERTVSDWIPAAWVTS